MLKTTNVMNVKKDSILPKKLTGNVLLVLKDAHTAQTLKHVMNVIMTNSINGITLCA